MRHRSNRMLEIAWSVQKRTIVMRVMLTNLITHGYMTTTEKKAKVLAAYADEFIAGMVKLYASLPEADATRIAINKIKSTLYGNDLGKTFLRDMVPSYVKSGKKSWFLSMTKLWTIRKGDRWEAIKITLDA